MRVVEWIQSAPAADEPEPAPAVEPPPPLPLAASTEPAPAPEEHSSPASPPPKSTAPVELGGWVGIHGGLALGVGPGVGGALALDGGLTGRWWRAGLAVHATPRRITEHPSANGVRGRFDLVTAEALGCGVPEAGPVDFPLCGRVAFGGLRGAGEGDVQQPEPAWGLWSGLGGSAGASWHATERLAPALSVEGLAPLQSRVFSVGGVPGVLHETGTFAFRAWLGLEIHL